MRSSDGGKTWTSFRGAPGGDDYQNLWINPNNGNIILIVSDQGAIVTVNAGASWSSWYNQPTAQLYHAITTNTFPYKVCGGQQECGSVCIYSRGNDGAITFRDWHPVGVIEYGYVAPDPLDPDVIYGGGRTEVSKFHWSTGQVQIVTPIPLRNPKYRTDRTEPLMFSPVDPHILYFAGNVLFKTTDGGNSWQTISPDLTREKPEIPASVGTLIPKGAEKTRGVIYALAPSFKTLDTLWAGTDDGKIWITHDAGKNWADITPRELTAWSKVTQISSSHFDEQTAYASVSRFRINDMHPYIYRTHDGGKTWKLIIAGLPDFGPVDTVREDPVRKGLLFAGTENAVWVSFDDGDHWQSLQLNLPHTSMRDLWIHDNDLIVATHGRAFWILDDIAPSARRRLTTQTPCTCSHPRPPTASSATPTPTRRFLPTNPPRPIRPTAQSSTTTCLRRRAARHARNSRCAGSSRAEVLQRRQARSHRRRIAKAVDPHVLDSQLPPTLRRLPECIAGSGICTIPHQPPRATISPSPRFRTTHRAIRSGPRFFPGATPSASPSTEKPRPRPLTVKMDPRVKTPLPGLQKKFQVETSLASTLSATSQAVLQGTSIRQQIDKLSAQADSPAKDVVEEFEKKLNAVLGAAGGFFAPPSQEVTLARVNGQAGTLYQQVWQADAEPTSSQIEALTSIEHDRAIALKRWNEFKSSELPALNRQLRESKIPEIQPETNFQFEETQIDEE